MQRVYIFIICIPLVLSCWNKQNNDVTRPLIPNYIFSGQAVDMDSAEPLPGISIKLQGVNMLYEKDFGTQVLQTDSLGMFAFDSVYPGSYNLSMERNGFFINETKFEMSHRDSSALLLVPKIMIAHPFSLGSSSNEPTLAISSTKAWKLTHSNSQNTNYPNATVYVYKLSDQVRWRLDAQYDRTITTQKIFCMAFGRDHVYFTVYPDTLYALNLYDASIAGHFSVGKNIHGIAFHIGKRSLVTCSRNFIYVHDQEKPAQIVQTYQVDSQELLALAYNKVLYAWDSGDHLLKALDDEMRITGNYALISSESEQQVTNINDMDFDGYGELWVSQY